MFCSIIIPLYNKERFIDVALQSILNQQHQHFEVLVIDDGSTDNSAARVKTFQDSRIRLLQQANAGVSCARNRGIELATGELVCFLDADDWYHPRHLESIVDMANHYPDVAFFANAYQRINAPAQENMTWDCEAIGGIEIIDDVLRYWTKSGQFFCTSCVAVRNELLKTLQPCFPPGESMAEDLDLFYRLAECSPLAYCPAPLVSYRVGIKGSLSATHELYKLVPAHVRLEQRALQRQMPDKYRASALTLVTLCKVTVARNLLIGRRRLDAINTLLLAWRGVVKIRWWSTLMLCLCCSSAFAKRWELRRNPNWPD
jgi:GT2 family glycosyltransferase